MDIIHQTVQMDETMVKMIVSQWETQNERVNKLVNSLTEENFSKEVADGRNSGTYLLGHLTAVNDGM